MTSTLDISIHEGTEPVDFRLVRRSDGSIGREGGEDGVRVTQLLLADDVGDDRSACDELLDAIQATSRGERDLVELAWDATEVEIRPGTSRVRLAAPTDACSWIDVPTRELYDALLQLRAFVSATT